MATLSPAPDTLGLASPALGPWFRDGSATTPTLAVPAANLAVALSLPAGMEWRAPAGGLASWAFAATPRPPVLTALRGGDGESAFGDGNLVVLFTLLPEVEVRLAALSAQIPSPDGVAVPAGAPGRPVVRHLALEVPQASAASVSDLQSLRENDFASDLDDDEKRAAFLGLDASGSALANADEPVRELHRPDKSNAVIVKNRSGAALSCMLWAFDDRGRALDAGAVAAWWAHLASAPVFDNLWAHGAAADQRTAPVAASRSVLFCTAHEGGLPEAQRLRLDLTDLTRVGGALYTAGAAPAIALTTSPSPDDLPLPRLAVLPNGRFAAPPGATPFAGWTGSAWPAGLARDFVRVAVVDLESHLVGVGRSDAVQNDPRQRIAVLRNTAATPILTTADAAHAALLGTLSTGSPAQLMAPVLDTFWGSLTAPSLGSGTPPATLAFSVHALQGEGTASGATAASQRIAVRVTGLPANAWVRIWPKGLDTETGQHFRLDGGAGRADGTGRAFAVLALPDGTAALQGMSFDALVVTDADAKLHVEQRFDRPAIASGARPALTPPPGGLADGRTAWMCEQGAALVRSSGQWGSGQTLLAVPGDEAAGAYALVDTTSTVAADAAASTLRNAAGTGDRLIVTAPAFLSTPEGEVVDATGPVGATGATVLHRTRNGLADGITTFGRPVAMMERREAAAVDPAGGTGAVGAAPGLASLHEALPGQLGHPGVPAAAEVHATGAALAGPAAVPLATLMRERAAADLAGFVGQAQRPVTVPSDPGGTTTFTAVLETLTHGVAGDAQLRAFVAATSGFTPGAAWTSLKNSIESAVPTVDFDPMIDTATFDDDALAAALDQVILKTRDGAAQAARSLASAIGRAEDFVYVETPALDPLAAGSGDGLIDLVSALTTRLGERPALAVVLCVPQKFLPNQPRKLEAVRTAGVRAALKTLLDAAPANVVLFTPTAGPSRPLHMASTTVVVDDVWLLTGSTHLWRRGLSFDSSLAVALFDEATTRGRSAALRQARRQLIADRLGVDVSLIGDDMAQLRATINRLNLAGGLQRVQPNVYPAAADTTSATDLQIWNPDGRPGGTSDWLLLLGGLTGTAADEVNNAIR
ncbi:MULTISPECIES: hypothetical protein [unclassified Roseateles]|uniref:hypothetical protein n=1 Tax=unclassified Roseateles TaxID=2626991 RepID=UPI0006FCE603|nr:MULTISPECIES: hypothetical protein [unclassified Roseateles]KQW49628.1 hypothetical protein ASC81_25385 [Pelomonas sp. Root405]KRA76087.1 hypothetical protein ASD88_25335 [Pelomonas sp. Root662]